MTAQEIIKQCEKRTEGLLPSLAIAMDENGQGITHRGHSLRQITAGQFGSFLDMILDLVGSIQDKNALKKEGWFPFDLHYLLFLEKLIVPGELPAIRIQYSIFAEDVNSNGHIFKCPVEFSNCEFRGRADFAGSHFQHGVNFTKTHFTGKGPAYPDTIVANFSGARFEGEVNLESTAFYGNSNFSEASFMSTTNFRATEFRQPSQADFTCAAFYKPLQFNVQNSPNMKFIFRKAIFHGFAGFQSLHFSSADFAESTFHDEGSFRGADFGTKVTFDGATFKGSADFSIGRSSAPMSFVSTRFLGRVDFRGFNFKNSLDFSNARFHRVPGFSKGAIHPETRIRNARFYGFNTEEDYVNFRVLKREFADLQARQEENMFFCFEQRAYCNLLLKDQPFSFPGIVSKLYDWISQYGQSPGRPFLWLLAFTAYFSLQYFLNGGVHLNPDAQVEWGKDFPPWVGYSLQNIVNPLTLFTARGVFQPGSGSLAILGVMQSALSLIFLALGLLAIRRRLRKASE